MFRAILEFLALLMFFAVARAVIAALGRLFTGAMQPPRQAPHMSQRQSDGVLHSAGELRKDPVCGTFVPVSTSLKQVVDGEMVYFCSADCRDRFLVATK
jgi:YHS domain-containing protein